MEQLRCVVERITYQNEQNGYSVLRCRAKGFQDLVTVVGNMPEVHVGAVLSLGGAWRVDPKYGRQFSVERFEETFNGDIGVVEKVDLEERTLSVRYDERAVEYDVTELDELVLAYAVHHVTVEGRNTMLKERLQRLRGAEPEASTEETAEHGALHDAWLERDLFERLAQSKFRSRFHLNDAERQYALRMGEETLRTHAEDLISKRLTPADIPNDGKQTPMRGHPVFVAQHATATCCRGCLEKWHGIPKGRALTERARAYRKRTGSCRGYPDALDRQRDKSNRKRRRCERCKTENDKIKGGSFY